ncbi:MAG: hypothetical protein LAT76_06205 [Schleiferiaceae bacterium]|jgi:hypothetical protein|nr:hypothetical protein [Schleiferiaceae bacterium]
MSEKHKPDASAGVLYGMGFVGAAFYFLSSATSFLSGVVGFLKAIVWPGVLIYEVFKFLNV